MVLIYKYKSNMYIKLFKRSAGGAWLSSIRVLIRLVKSKNEWNPQVYFVRSFLQSFKINWLSMKYWTKVRIMSSRYAPYRLGYPYDTMAVTKRNLELILS